MTIKSRQDQPHENPHQNTVSIGVISALQLILNLVQKHAQPANESHIVASKVKASFLAKYVSKDKCIPVFIYAFQIDIYRFLSLLYCGGQHHRRVGGEE